MRDAPDVTTTIKFAIQHNIQLTVKATGHDYQGRSTAPGSLNIWLYNLKNVTYIEDFSTDCPGF